MENYKKVLFQAVALIVGLYFFFLAVVEAKPFLAPLVMALILALVMMPVSNKLEKWGMGRVYASLACTIMLLLLSIGFAALISLQLSEFLSDFDKVQQRIMPLVRDAEQMVYSNTPLSDGDIKSQDAMSAKSIGTRALSFLNSFYSFLGDFLLTFIYIFFMLNYRSKFRKFIIKLFDSAKREKISKVLTEAAELTQGYLFGKFILIVFLAVLYGVGMGLTGVSNFIVISIIAALLTIIPYIGNIVGFVLAIGLGYITDGDTTALVGIIATFTAGQFVESYVLEPYVVGNKVNLDPLMTIIAVVAGSFIWGVTGMIIAVPILGIVNIIFGHVQFLKPISYLFSSNSKE